VHALERRAWPLSLTGLKKPRVRADAAKVMKSWTTVFSFLNAGIGRTLVRLIVCLAVCVASTAQAEWVELEKDDDIAHFWDKESVRRIHVTRYVWTLTELPKAIKGPSGDNYQSTMTRWRVHCKTDMFVRLSVSYFEKPQGKGREVTAQDDQEWRSREAPIRPGTYLALLKKELCDSAS
jgi:hypothetical protein